MNGVAEYRSILLEPNWAHQAYFGWRLRESEPGLSLFFKERFGVERVLALIEPGYARLTLTATIPRRLNTAEIVIHDFNAGPLEPYVSNGRAFAPLDAKDRLLNVATYVVDLTRDEDELFGAMNADYRRKIRKAASAGTMVEPIVRPAAALRERFATAFGKMARERGLSMFDKVAYARMYENGDAILYVLRQAGEETGYLHAYRAGQTAIFMTGVTPAKANDGAGQLLHWEIIRDMKRRGLHWYDLGGVRSFEDADGISRFKRGFGGAPVNLGGEWRWRARWVDGALAARRLLSGGA